MARPYPGEPIEVLSSFTDHDAYVYYRVETKEFLCAGCSLNKNFVETSFAMASSMRDHLVKHRRAGHHIPESAFLALDRLAREEPSGNLFMAMLPDIVREEMP